MSDKKNVRYSFVFGRHSFEIDLEHSLQLYWRYTISSLTSLLMKLMATRTRFCMLRSRNVSLTAILCGTVAILTLCSHLGLEYLQPCCGICPYISNFIPQREIKRSSLTFMIQNITPSKECCSVNRVHSLWKKKSWRILQTTTKWHLVIITKLYQQTSDWKTGKIRYRRFHAKSNLRVV